MRCKITTFLAYWIIFYSLAPPILANENAPPQASITPTFQSEFLRNTPLEGLFFVIGVFRNLPNAHHLTLRYNKFSPSIIAARLKGKRVFHVIVGPIKKGYQKATRTKLHKAGISDAWVRRFYLPKSKNDGLKRNKVVQTKSVPFPQKIAPKIFRPGDTFSDCRKCPLLVVIPVGEFIMGETNGGQIGDAPAVAVSLPIPIAIGRFEVTFAEWDACVDGGGCFAYNPPDEGWGRLKRPVTNVNWNDALEYLAWLSKKTSHKYRLPSEAEWEYAARAGSITDYWWSKNLGINQAACQNCGSIYDGEKTAPVGSFSPNAFGLYDTAGNLWEWTQDCYLADAYKNHPSYPSPVLGPKHCSRVLRGGGWDVLAAGIKSSFRFSSGSSNRTNYFGFRVVRELK